MDQNRRPTIRDVAAEANVSVATVNRVLSGSGAVRQGMRERVRLVGGRHDIESSPGEGTTVHAWIPASRLDPAPAARAGSG